MKVSISIWSMQSRFYQNRLDTIGFLNLASGWNVDGIELLDFFFKNEAEIQDAIELLDRKGLLVSALSIENDFATECEEDLEAQVVYVKEQIDLAIRLKTKILRVLSGIFKQGLHYDLCMENIIKGLKSCAEYAEQKGITMVLENHGVFSGTSQKVASIIEKVNSLSLKSNIDTGNFLLNLENPVEAVKKLMDKIAFVHIKDLKKLNKPNGFEVFMADDSTLFQGTIAGKGDVDLQQIVSILKDGGYDGYLSVEYEGVGSCIEDTEESIAYVKRLLEEQVPVSVTDAYDYE